MVLSLPDLHEVFKLSHEEAHLSLWFVALETFILLWIFSLIIELAGRKTMAQMTILQLIVTVGIGEALLMPVIDKDFSIWKSITIVIVMVLFLIINEWLSLKFNWFERIFTPKAMVVIEDGKIIEKNLKKLRLSVDQLEMYLRQQQVESIDIVKTATVEGDGKLGIQLFGEEQPLTVRDMLEILKNKDPDTRVDNDIFFEVRNVEHRNKNNHKKKLQ